MIRRAIVTAVLALAVFAMPAAATPQQTIKQLRTQLKSANKQISRLTVQRDGFDGKWLTAKANLTSSQAALAAMTADRNAQVASLATAATSLGSAQADLSTANASIANLQVAVNGQVQGLNDPQLWSLLGAIYARMTAIGGTTFSTSSFTGSSLKSYDFDWYSF